MAQRQLNFPRIEAVTKYYSLLIGHEGLHIIHPDLFSPKAKAYRDGQPIKSEHGWEKSYDIPEWELGNQTVTAWTSKQSHYSELEPKQKGIINYIKNFLNCDKWKCLVVFHGTDCRVEKQYTYGNHLHVILQTTNTTFSSEGLYRSMYEAMGKMGGIVSLTPIRDNMQGLLKYLIEDDEKLFLGASSDELRELWATAADYVGPKVVMGEAETVPASTMKRKAVPFVKEVKKPNMTLDAEDMQVPTHLQNKSRLPEMVNFLIEILRQNKDTRDINDLTTKYGLFSTEGQALCNIALSTNGQKAITLALKQVEEEENRMTLEEKVKELPDTMPDYMDIRSSQALFNAWCMEQGISPRKYAMTMQLLLGEQSYKKIGLYLQGRPNSGKTALTNNMWKCMGQSNGRITKETFCFQDCAGKKLIIGEEISISENNVDRFKDLLSGGTMMCEIKQKAPAPCTPKIVMMNSNNHYQLNLGRNSAEQIKVRLYLFQDLKVSNVLKEMKGHFHPRMFYDNILPISQEEANKLKTNTGDWDMEPLGGTQYTGDWGEIFGEAEADMHQQVPYSDVGPEHEAEAAAQEILHELDNDVTETCTNEESPKSPDTGDNGMRDVFSESWPTYTEWVPEAEEYETVETEEHSRQVQDDMLSLAMQAADEHRDKGKTWEETKEEVEGDREVKEHFLKLAENIYKDTEKVMDEHMKKQILAASDYPGLLRTEPLDDPKLEELAYKLAYNRAKINGGGGQAWVDVEEGTEIGDRGEFYFRANYLEAAVLRGYTPAPATLRVGTYDNRHTLLEQIRNYSSSPITVPSDSDVPEWDNRWNSQPDSEPLDTDNVISSERKRKHEEEEEQRTGSFKRVRNYLTLEQLMTKTDYGQYGYEEYGQPFRQPHGQIDKHIGNLLNDVQKFYSRRVDQNAGRWEYTIVFGKKTEHSIRGDGDRPWTPSTSSFTSLGSMFHLGGYIHYTDRLCGSGAITKLILQDTEGWRALEVDIPAIYTDDGDVSTVIIKAKSAVPEGQMSQYIRTSADTIPTMVSPCNDADTIAEKCFNYIRLLGQELRARHTCVDQERNKELRIVKVTLKDVLDRPDATAEDHEVLRLFELYYPFVVSI